MRNEVCIVKYVSEIYLSILFSFRSQSTSSLNNVLGVSKGKRDNGWHAFSQLIANTVDPRITGRLRSR